MDWFIWRPILAEKARKFEADTCYTLVDWLDLHDALDLQEEADELALKEARKD